MIRATVKGGLLVMVIQGLLGGLTFWFLEVVEALLWGADGISVAVADLGPVIAAMFIAVGHIYRISRSNAMA